MLQRTHCVQIDALPLPQLLVNTESAKWFISFLKTLLTNLVADTEQSLLDAFQILQFYNLNFFLTLLNKR